MSFFELFCRRSLQHRWSQRLSSVIYSNRNLWKTSGNNPPSELDATKSCKEVACVVLLPSLLLSLVLIGVCSLFIYLHLLHKYHSEIDTLKAELKAARDKDGVFLPKDIYDMQMQDREKSELSLRRKTQELKSLEVKLEKFKVLLTIFFSLSHDYYPIEIRYYFAKKCASVAKIVFLALIHASLLLCWKTLKEGMKRRVLFL